MKSLNCPNCGATLQEKNIKHDIASCEYCGTSFRMAKSLTPEPDMGDLILAADFKSEMMPGWETFNKDKLVFQKTNPPEVHGTFTPNKETAYYVLKSSGLLDDFDVSVTLRFIAGDEEMVRGGFYLRFSDDGGYTILISAISTYQVGVFNKDKDDKLVWKKIISWTKHTALKNGLGQNNRVRVLCNRDQFRLYFNGVLATSFKDSSYSMGKLCLTADPSANLDATFAFSDLQLREVKM
jgi:DNA-directed RNA polymerase subunit RPC12/RpoP